jgi:hypothetical protein
MATGYGTYSETTYTAHTDNMGVTSANWLYELYTERPDLSEQAPVQWNLPIWWGDRYSQITNGLLLTGMSSSNTDNGKLYGTIAGATLTLYKDSAKVNSVGSITGSAFTALNTSGIAASSDFAFTLSGTPTATTTLVFKFTTLDIELEKLRSDVANEIIRRLMQRPELERYKPEYLARLEDNTQLARAEIACAMYLFYRKQIDGDPDDAKSVMQTVYEGILAQEIARPLAWDMSISITEDDTDVTYSAGGASIAVDFL